MPNREASENQSEPFQDHHEKKNIVKSLASNFNLQCIQLKNIGRPKKESSESERPWGEEFFKQTDITYTG